MVHDLQPGDPQLVGPYRIRGVLGGGGMGRVFLGVSAEGRLVALKVVRADLAADPAFRARFQREAAVARKVSGPFTAPVIDADLDGPTPWLATAYVAGPSLADVVTGHGPMAPGPVFELAAALAEGLEAIHAAGVVHRDLKPSNILLAQDGPRLIDFGISSASGATTLTGAGLMIGSPGFMSPEQAEGLPVGPASDIFSLGAVLAFAATGEGPFGVASIAALIYRVIHRPADLSRVPGEVRGLIERCLVKDPALRPTARDLVAATATARPQTISLLEPAAPAIIAHPSLRAVSDDSTEPVPLLTPVPVLGDHALVPPDLPGYQPSAPDSSVLHLLAPAGSAPDRPRRAGSAPDRPRRGTRHPKLRRYWPPLAAAAVVVGLLGAAGLTQLIVTAGNHQPPAIQSERQAASVHRSSPAASAARSSADPPTTTRKSPSAVPSSGGATSPGGSPLEGTTPLANTAPPASANAPVVPPTHPSASASPTSRPHPSASMSPNATPKPSGTPKPSATPTPSATSTYGGY
jgi:eukaryotic-like serine/threonine-protein kinase